MALIVLKQVMEEKLSAINIEVRVSLFELCVCCVFQSRAQDRMNGAETNRRGDR